MKRAALALPNAGKADKPRKVEVIRTTYKPSCTRQSLGSSVKLAWKKAIQADTERMRTIVWLGSRAFLHYLTTNVATGKTTLPCDDDSLNRLIRACFTVHCDDTKKVASRGTPPFVQWRDLWESTVARHLPQGGRVSVKGLGNALSCEAKAEPSPKRASRSLR